MEGLGGAAPSGPSFDGRSVLLLTNYRGGGIGDFGAGLARAARSEWPGLEIVETKPGGEGALRQSFRAGLTRRALLANVGLTAWGTSGVRNLLGFRGIGFHRFLGRPTLAIVHHTIEMFGEEDSGYRVSRWVRWGARRATRALARSDLVAFSPRVAELLHDSYGARSVWLTPLPGETPQARVDRSGPAKVVSAGYWAPYKGLDNFLAVAERLKGQAGFVLAGTGHPILGSRSPLRERILDWKTRAASLGVQTPGYLDDAALSEAFSGRSVGLLPYTAASGASAAFTLFTQRGIPVVSSDLPEFQYLESLGAGVVPTTNDPEALAEAVQRLLDDPAAWGEASRRQLEFGARYDWSSFLRELVARWSGPRAHAP